MEECLRFDGPIMLTVRILHEDAEFDGKGLVIAQDWIVTGIEENGVFVNDGGQAKWRPVELGPILRDKIWFFASYEQILALDTPQDANTTTEENQQNFLGKITPHSQG